MEPQKETAHAPNQDAHGFDTVPETQEPLVSPEQTSKVYRPRLAPRAYSQEIKINRHSIQVIHDQQIGLQKQMTEMCMLIRQNTQKAVTPQPARAPKAKYNPKYRGKMLHNIDLSANDKDNKGPHPFANITVKDFDQICSPAKERATPRKHSLQRSLSLMNNANENVARRPTSLGDVRSEWVTAEPETIHENEEDAERARQIQETRRKKKIGVSPVQPPAAGQSVKWNKLDYNAGAKEASSSKRKDKAFGKGKNKNVSFSKVETELKAILERMDSTPQTIRNSLFHRIGPGSRTASQIHGSKTETNKSRECNHSLPIKRKSGDNRQKTQTLKASRYNAKAQTHTAILECGDKERLSIWLQNQKAVPKRHSTDIKGKLTIDESLLEAGDHPKGSWSSRWDKSIILTSLRSKATIRKFHRLVHMIREGRLARVNVGGHDSRILDMDQSSSWISYTVEPKWWIMVPEEHSYIRWYWDFLLVILLLVFAVWIPLSIGFKKSEIPPWFEITAASIFFLDIIFLFATPYCITGGPYEGSYESRPLKIATKYLETWFVFDLITSIPLDLVAQASTTEINVNVINTLRVLKLLRTFRLARLFKRLDQFARMNLSLVRCYHLCFCCFCCMHGIACVYWGICEYEEFDNSGWSPDPSYEDMDLSIQYCKAFSWVLAVMLSRGSFDDAETSTEFVLTMLFCMIGVVFYAFIVGSATAFFSELDNENGWKRRRLNQMSQFLKQRKVKQSLSRQILKYYQYRWSRNLDTAERIDLFDDLHISLKRNLDLFLIQSMVVKVPMFQEITEPCLEAIMECLDSRIFLPGEWVVIAGEAGTEMYIIARGRFEVLPDVSNPPVAVLCEGEFFGEGSLITSKPRNCSIRSQCHGELLVLSASDFISILQDFPIFAISVEKNSNHVKDSSGWNKIRYAVNLCSKYKLVGYQNVSFVDMMLSLNDLDEEMNSKVRRATVDNKKKKKQKVKRLRSTPNVLDFAKNKKKKKKKKMLRFDTGFKKS